MSVKSWLAKLSVIFVITVVVNTVPLSVLAETGEIIRPMQTVNELVVGLNDDYFNPEDITIPSGKTTKIILKNTGKKEHTFTVKQLGIDTEVQPGMEKTITVNPKKPGTYELICRYHQKEGMVGKVIVK